ncbi:putative sensor histidine kinase PhoR [Nocardioides szechwanensis]|uniref:histidine kinase n=1 Tax=Nocardioides szechwanensis TaxID=1005944 RepID=A0A1H0H8T5_9ACTN|nr:HAMP domain-containing sensor histidine kinase [Nocardioides szechwanensis]GEP34219.1 putative sensor histidine kinase PhoR [Nocardioides szechwanensis]SDO15523.1 two-component system, OmpR family, sensor kinase [Nocardioides szechwanensis]
MRLPSLGLSIRARLVLGMVLLISAGLAAANVSGILLLRSYLLDRLDSQVGSVAPEGQEEPPPGAPGVLCANPRDPQGLRSDFLLLVLDADGNVTCSLGPDLGDAAPLLDQADLGATDELVTVPSVDGESRWRVRAESDNSSGQTVVFAVSLADADATVSRLTWFSLLVSALVLMFTAAAAWAIARIGLQPLERIEETAEHIAAGDLSERVPTYRRNTEVGRLAHALNGMLGQIERAFSASTTSEARLRTFISDASHELRTPVAAIRGHAEMWRTGISTDLDTVMTRIESESKRMGDLVDDMLLLAHLDQSRPLERTPVDLLSLATDAVVDTQALQPERQIAIDAQPGADPPVVVGDQSRLRQVLANLLTNALAHTPASSPIEVGVRTRDRQVEVTVRDAGPGMAPEVLAKVFDRFYRADPGRTRSHGGSGLGLAIVKSLTEAHGGTVTCSSDLATGSTFVVSLPLLRGDSA